MRRCSECGAELEPTLTEYIENGWEITVERIYQCKCGHSFLGKSYYKSEGYEDIKPLDK